MHGHSLERWQYEHDYLPHTQDVSERRTRLALALTVVMMVAELITGYATGSLALTADGWHMGSHAVALGVGVFAYMYSRRHAANARFTFGTGKVGPLAGYTSALVLAGVAASMVLQSVERFLQPVEVAWNEALWVAVVGLVVNLACMALLRDHGHGHEHAAEAPAHHGHDHAHDHGHGHTAAGHCAGHDSAHAHDHNLRATYLHVAADAVTSVLAIVALLCGKYMGWTWMDAAAGIVGAAVIAQWSVSLIRRSAHALLDAEDNAELVGQVRRIIEGEADNRIADLHVWRVGPLSHACIVSVVTHHPQPAEHYKALLCAVPGLAHVTVEVNVCCSQPLAA